MASSLYPSYKAACLGAGTRIDLDSDTIKVALVNITTDYTYNSAHQYLSSVTRYSGTTDQTLTNISISNGVFDADDVTFSTVSASSGKSVGALVIYKDTGSAATSPVIAYIDGFTTITPNGGPVNIIWDSGSAKIFAL